jgi:tetratricopeptide (TPR) repeat protein
VLYNAVRAMRGTPLFATLLAVCAWTAVTVPSHAQQAASPSHTSSLAFPASAWRAIAHGKPADAESLAKARPTGDPDAAAVLGHLAAARGRYEEAIATLQPAAAGARISDAALELALLEQRLGRSAEATRLLTALFQDGGGSGEPRSLLRAGRAAQALGRAHEANAFYRSASASGRDPAVDTTWGLLFLEKYNYPEAVKSFQQALGTDADWAPAHAGMARALAEDDPPAAAAAAARALAIDPNLADAELLLAQLDLDNTEYGPARERIDRVLAYNPSHFDALALGAAIVYVRDGRAPFDAAAKRILAINPANGEVYRAAAELAARNYRFDEAVGLAREAVALDPTNARAHAELGMHLMRTGDEAEARRSLERAFRADPFDKITYNLLQLLDTLDNFVVFREGEIVLKLHADEAAIMRDYVMPFAQEALRTLSQKYRFTPKGPILVEMFPVHDDFAVRTLGLPGLIGALGACFGRVVTLDSPRARTVPGTYSWEATLWHEMAHVITLQMSAQRVPRWLTEGISVYEESRRRPEWGRDMEVPFAVALERGKALKLKDLNSGFTRPDTIALAYFEASLLVGHIVQAYGEPKLQALVASYGQGLEGDAAVEKTLGVPLEQLQASFDKALDARFGPLRAALKDTGLKPQGTDIAALRMAAVAKPGSYAAQLALGQALAAEGDREAFEPLEKAAALVPVAIGEDSPHAIMARLAEKLGDTPRAIQEYQALLAQDHTTVDPARRLAALAEKTAAAAPLLLAYDRVVALDPFDAPAHTGLGRVALQRSDAATAIREFKAALAIGAPDRAAAHCDLGEAYLLGNQPAAAKKEALAALEIAPTFARAQELLLRAIKTAASVAPKPSAEAGLVAPRPLAKAETRR